jgi:hypothetical protein
VILKTVDLKITPYWFFSVWIYILSHWAGYSLSMLFMVLFVLKELLLLQKLINEQ